MKALRKIVKSENRKITLEVPSDFGEDQDFEVIVLPVEEGKLEKASRKFGSGKDNIGIHDSFYEPLEDFREYM